MCRLWAPLASGALERRADRLRRGIVSGARGMVEAVHGERRDWPAESETAYRSFTRWIAGVGGP